MSFLNKDAIFLIIKIVKNLNGTYYHWTKRKDSKNIFEGFSLRKELFAINL